MKSTILFKYSYFFYFLLFGLFSCSTAKQVNKQANRTLIDSKELSAAHIGITLFDPKANKFIVDYQGEKLFIPASNTKLFTLYAGLKYLKDSIIAARAAMHDGEVILQATGDPTFLHPDFKQQPLLNFLQRKDITSVSINTNFSSKMYGLGWAWDDYEETYMPERDPFPMYGNIARVIFSGDTIVTVPPVLKQLVVGTPVAGKRWAVTRELGAHYFTIDTARGTTAREKVITMAMEGGRFAVRNLADTLHKPVTIEAVPLAKNEGFVIYSQHRDSLFKIMMHRSDNFFAEQSLLMTANEMLGEMNEGKLIDTLLKSDLKGLPQKAKWVDGSGLSRYNLISPKDFVWLLNKLDDEFGFEKMKVILPGANEGTLEGLYKGYDGNIWAKTGTLNNSLALSGYLVTKKNKRFIFSILVNNHQSSAQTIRRLFEKFLTGIIDKY